MNDRLNSLIIFIILMLLIFGAFYYFRADNLQTATQGFQTSNNQEVDFESQFHHYEALDGSKNLPPFNVFNIDGETEDLGQHQEEITLINFWATWCAPCLIEIPTLLELEEQLNTTSFKVVFISFDYPKEPEDLHKRMAALKIPDIKTYYVKDTQLWDLLDVKSLPFSIVVNKKSEILYQFYGEADWSQASAIAFFKSLLSADN
jgi:thiol-disulfide isomerase/thioredoxin